MGYALFEKWVLHCYFLGLLKRGSSGIRQSGKDIIPSTRRNGMSRLSLSSGASYSSASSINATASAGKRFASYLVLLKGNYILHSSSIVHCLGRPVMEARIEIPDFPINFWLSVGILSLQAYGQCRIPFRLKQALNFVWCVDARI